MKRFFLAVIVVLIVLLVQVNGEEKEAVNLTSTSKIIVSDNQSADKIKDGSQYGSVTYKAGTTIDIECDKDVSGIYIIWDKKVPKWILDVNDKTNEYGTKGFLHEFVSVDKTNKLSIVLNDSGSICEIYLFGEGKLPSWVQIWKEPNTKADLMLLSTHSDDEQLFYAGILPYYAGEKNLKVQVVYMTNHNDTQSRPHEQLNGLWKVGVRNYPIIGEFPDLAASYGKSIEDLTERLNNALNIFDEEKLIAFQVEMIRRFKPQVIVAHDIKGEYGHGAHMANTHTLMKALELSYLEDKYTEYFNKYGAWDVPKTYIHLWKENKVVMNWDIPLEKFGGKTAFEVSREGYKEHESQQWTWFTKWIAGEGINKASDIKTYSPCEFGLYRTKVGNDTGLNDFFENITPYVDPTPVPITPEPTATITPEVTVTPTSTPYSSNTPINTPGSRSDNFDSKLIVVVISTIILLCVFIGYIVFRKKR